MVFYEDGTGEATVVLDKLNLAAGGTKRYQTATSLLLGTFTLLDQDKLPKEVKFDFPAKLCRKDKGKVCYYLAAVLADYTIIRPRILKTSWPVVDPAAVDKKLVQEVVVPVDGVADDPLAETSIVVEYDPTTGEGTLALPSAAEPPAGRKQGPFPFCFWDAQAGAAILRSIGLVHGIGMPGAAPLAQLTDGSAIVVEMIEEHPIENPKKKGGPYNPLGTSNVVLQMSTAYPIIERFVLDVSQLQWQQLPCPPAPHTFEWSPVTFRAGLLVEQGGDYYLGYERQVGMSTSYDFFNYKRLRSVCVPVAGTFSEIPDQLTVVGASYAPDTGAAAFVATVLPNDGRQFVRSDANGDGAVDIGDAVFTLSYLFRDGEAPAEVKSADVNDDGSVDLGDVVTMLSYLFRDDAETMIRAPYLEMDPTRAGWDPTSDGL
jgi:hypothetical protein